MAVFMVSAFTAPETSADFAKFFFWAGLLCSFVGLPIASRAQAKDSPLSHSQQSILFILFFFIASVISWFFWNDSLYHFGIVLAATAMLSIFEINRVERASEGHFALLTVCSIVSLILLVLVLIFHEVLANGLVIAIFAGLTLPVLLSYVLYPHKVKETINLVQALKPVSSHAFSSLISTGLTFAIPLLLVEEFGSENSALLAQIYSVSAMAFVYPRYISTGFIVKAKKGEATLNTVRALTKNIALFLLVSFFAYIALTQWLAPKMTHFFLLFVSMQLSQLSMIYANWWISHGKEFSVMLLNIFSLLVLCVALAVIYVVLPEGELRGHFILGASVCFQILRYFIYVGAEKYKLG